jgi:dCMP deaminase
VNGQHQVVGVGYNGTLPGKAGCLSGACPRGLINYKELPKLSDYSNCIGVHAEDNCLKNSFALDMYRSINEPLTMYITREPCPNCWSLMLNNGVIRMVWPEGSWQDV